MDSKAMEPFGQALIDYQNRDKSAIIDIERDDGYIDRLPVNIFFREENEFSIIDHLALDNCRPHVLDVGAGAGRHSLILQNRGIQVTANDISPLAIIVLKQRGIRNVIEGNIFNLSNESFSTILLLGHSIGIVETLNGLDSFLLKVKSLLNPDGQILCDSVDVRKTKISQHLQYHDANRQAGRYFGEVRVRFKYNKHTGPWFGWLHVDPKTLSERAGIAGYYCKITHQESSGEYLARMILDRT
ncbi:class I SAM-dependent methyltransferase [Bacteroidota bacterium]